MSDTHIKTPVKGAFRLERLEERHLPAILAIEKECNSAPWSERSFRNELNNPHGIFLVAIERGEIIGYGGIWLVVDEAHITTIAVKPDRRREGLGRHITHELLRRVAEHGAVCATLEVRAGNKAAISLYESLGFVQTGKRKRYYPDNDEDAIVMWRHELDSVALRA